MKYLSPLKVFLIARLGKSLLLTIFLPFLFLNVPVAHGYDMTPITG